MLGARMQMASRSGDMRRLLDACAAAVDLLVQEASEPQQDPQSGAPSHTCQHMQMSVHGLENSVPECLMELSPGIAWHAHTSCLCCRCGRPGRSCSSSASAQAGGHRAHVQGHLPAARGCDTALGFLPCTPAALSLHQMLTA